MNKQLLIKKTEQFIKKEFSLEGSGHDWWHIFRVWQIAKRIAKTEKADLFVVEMAALLHDLGDYKLEPDRKDRQAEKVGKWLTQMKVKIQDTDHILHIITHMSYSKNVVSQQELSLEGKVVQDADRLDAIGAIGIARNFVYDGYHGIQMYIPDLKPNTFKSNDDYKQREGVGINHFYEKLLLLKDKMNTKTAKKLASQRHKYMEKFLEEFYAEWEGEK